MGGIPPGRWLRCDECQRVAGTLNDRFEEVWLASVGEVTEVSLDDGWIICHRPGGCQRHKRHPVVCSDSCERALLERYGLRTDRVGIEDADHESRLVLERERAYLSERGDTDAARAHLLILKRCGLKVVK